MTGNDLRELARSASLHPVAGGAVVHVPATQRLYALSTAAALVWLDLRDEVPRSEIERTLATELGIAPATAAEWVSQALSGFEASMVAAPEAPARAALPRATPGPELSQLGQDYILLDQRIRIAAPREAWTVINSVFGHLRAPDRAESPPRLWIHVEARGAAFLISSSHDDPITVDAAGLAAEVERLIVQDGIPAVPHFLAFHAALLRHGTTAALLPAPSGSGKTSLAIALAERGWAFLTDELALLDRDLSWRGLPLPPCVKKDNWARIGGHHPQLAHAPPHHRFGRDVKFLDIPISQFRTATEIVVFPQYQSNSGATTLRCMSPFDGLKALLRQCVHVPPGFESGDLERLLHWHDGMRYMEMIFSDPWQAADDMGSLIGPLAILPAPK